MSGDAGPWVVIRTKPDGTRFVYEADHTEMLLRIINDTPPDWDVMRLSAADAAAAPAMREALEFYGDESLYHPGNAELHPHARAALLGDRGARARKALEGDG